MPDWFRVISGRTNRMTTVRRALAPATLVAALILAGCSDDADAPPPPPSTTPAALPSPTASETTATPEEEAERVVREYVAGLNEGESKEGTATLTRISHPSCFTCSGLIEALERFQANGDRIEPSGANEYRIEKISRRTPKRVEAVIAIERPATLRYPGGEGPGVEFERSRERYRATIVSSDDGWLMRELVELGR